MLPWNVETLKVRVEKANKLKTKWIIRAQATTIKNEKIGLSQIIAFTGASKLTDANDRAMQQTQMPEATRRYDSER